LTLYTMPIDLNLLREDKGGDPELVRESCRRRFHPPEIVDEIIAIDQQWRNSISRLDVLKKELRIASKAVGELKVKIRKSGKPQTKEQDEMEANLRETANNKKNEIAETEKKEKELAAERDAKLNRIGNLVPDDVPVSKDEHNNEVVAKWGVIRPKTGRERHHHELLWMIGGYEPNRGTTVAGHRGYFLTGPGVQLSLALQSYGLQFLQKRGYTSVYPPYFMKKDVMAQTAQLSEFDEALYHVKGDRDEEYYLIATSEQPISAMHKDEWIHPKDLPYKYAGLSTCFRKEAGSHGRDAWGIFRVHQFEKIEQFVYCPPDKSWEMHKEMLKIAEEFYQKLEIPYHVVNIVSGELNNAAAKKFDLEGWFPTLACYRELVSCSNCLDYQARAMNTRIQKKQGDREKVFVHMLNATLCATTRTICCILENYQEDDGVRVPEALQPFVGTDFFPYVRGPPDNATKRKQEMAKKKKGGKK